MKLVKVVIHPAVAMRADIRNWQVMQMLRAEGIRIEGVRLLEKSGGRSGRFVNPER